MVCVLEIVFNMNKKIKKITNFSPDDYFGTQNGNPDSEYKYTLNKVGSSYEINDLGPCMNPNGFVSNIDCPEDDPYCNCPKALQPKEKEPSGISLMELRKATNECVKIKEELSVKNWFGVDYSNQYCSFNCFDPDALTGSCGASMIYKGLSGICGGTGESGNFFPYDRRKAFTYRNFEGEQDLSIIFSNMLYGLTGISGISGISADSSQSTGPTGNFKDYLAYSKTNATFWNTPAETPLYRRAQTMLLTYQRIKITVNGLFDIKPGNTIKINMPTGESKMLPNTRFHGSWMIYKVQRVITSQKHSMILFLMRDGNELSVETSSTDITTDKEPNN